MPPKLIIIISYKMNEYKLKIDNLIIYWNPQENNTWYTFSISYLEDYFVKDHVINKKESEFPISYIPEKNPDGKYSGKLFMDLSNNSLNVSLESPVNIRKKLYPNAGTNPIKPSQNNFKNSMNLESLNYKSLFPYIYIQPWPDATIEDMEKNFTECCNHDLNIERSSLSNCEFDNKFYKKLVELRSKDDRKGMEDLSINFINAYNQNKEPVFTDQYKDDLSKINTFYKQVYEFGVELRSIEKLSFDEFILLINKYFDSVQNLKEKMDAKINKDENEKIILSYIALMITFGYNFHWMIKVQIIIITSSLLHKFLQNRNSNNNENDEIPKPELIHDWIWATIILPQNIFPIPLLDKSNQGIENDSEYIRPYSLGNLRMVKYKLMKYTMGEVSKIENILKGETKTVEERHLHKIDYETNFSEDNNVKWKEAIIETFDGSVEESENTLKGKKSETTYQGAEKDSIGGWTIDDDPAGGYNNNSNAYARNIVNNAVEIMSQKINYSRSKRHSNEHEEKVIHQFNNVNGKEDIVGIYRWINKIYEFKIIEFGNRVMLEVFCKNPAEFYLQNEKQFHSTSLKKVCSPDEFGIITYKDISENETNVSNNRLNKNNDEEMNKAQKYYLNLLEYYEISDYPSPPETKHSIDVNISGMLKTEHFFYIIPIEYIPKKITGSVLLTEKISQITLNLGNQEKIITKSDSFEWDLKSNNLNGNKIEIMITCSFKETNKLVFKNEQSNSIKSLYNLNFYIDSLLKSNILNEWKYKIFINLKNGYKKRINEYYTLVNERKKEISSNNNELNKDIILMQLKKKCINILKKNIKKSILINNENKKNLELHKHEYGELALLQFIDQGIEWDKLTYYLDPDYENPTIYSNSSTERNFSSFLRAKFAKVLIPIKQNNKFSYLFFMATGLLWPGNDKDVPIVYDYLDYFNQIKNLDGDSNENDVEESWNVKVPTSLSILQDNSSLSEFKFDQD